MFAEKANIPPKGMLLFVLSPGYYQKGVRNVTPTASNMASFLLTVLMESRQLMDPLRKSA